MSQTRWLAVANAADAITQKPSDARLHLQTLLERFGPELDPVDDFEAWALRQLLRSLVNSPDDLHPR